MPGKKWRIFNYLVEVAIESPKDVDEEEAAEDASEFMETIRHRQARIHESFASITRVDEITENGGRRPPWAPVVIKEKKKKKKKVQKATIKKPKKTQSKKTQRRY